MIHMNSLTKLREKIFDYNEIIGINVIIYLIFRLVFHASVVEASALVCLSLMVQSILLERIFLFVGGVSGMAMIAILV